MNGINPCLPEHTAWGRLRCSRQRRSLPIQRGIDLSVLEKKKTLKNQPAEPHAALPAHRRHTAHLSGVSQGGKILMQGLRHAGCSHSLRIVFVYSEFFRFLDLDAVFWELTMFQ